MIYLDFLQAILDSNRMADGSATPPSNYAAFVMVALVLAGVVVWCWILLLWMIFRSVYPLYEEQEFMWHKQRMAATNINYGVNYQYVNYYQ